MDGMPVPQLAARKKQLVQELNGFIAKKKAMSGQAEQSPTFTGRKGSTQPMGQDGENPPVPLSSCHTKYSFMLF